MEKELGDPNKFKVVSGDPDKHRIIVTKDVREEVKSSAKMGVFL